MKLSESAAPQSSLVVDEMNACWVADDTLMTVPLGGGAAVALSNVGWSRIAVFGPDVFVASGESILRLPEHTCALERAGRLLCCGARRPWSPHEPSC